MSRLHELDLVKRPNLADGFKEITCMPESVQHFLRSNLQASRLSVDAMLMGVSGNIPRHDMSLSLILSNHGPKFNETECSFIALW